MTKVMNKKEPVKNLGLRLPLPLHKALVAEAIKDRRSLKDEVIVLLSRVLKLEQ